MARTASRLARVAVGKGESGLQRSLSVRSRSAIGASYGGNRLAVMKLPKRQLSAVPKGEAEQVETGERKKPLAKSAAGAVKKRQVSRRERPRTAWELIQPSFLPLRVDAASFVNPETQTRLFLVLTVVCVHFFFFWLRPQFLNARLGRRKPSSRSS